ncbi:MAG: hypothetical protein ABIC91_00185 [Nanoarchaeota archaeon]
MLLVQQTIPKDYDKFTSLIYDSADKGYKNLRMKQIQYFSLNVHELVSLIDELFVSNKVNKFLLNSEKQALVFAKNVFENRNKNITFDQFSEFIRLSFQAVVDRIVEVEKNLKHLIKKNHFKIKQADNEYFLALSNILNQIIVLEKEIQKDKHWKTNFHTRPDRFNISQKIVVIYKNLNKLALSLALNDQESIEDISNDILGYNDISFHITEKLIS